MTRSGAILRAWKRPAPSAGNAGFYLSSPPHSPVDPKTRSTDAGMCVYCTRHMCATPATWCSVSMTMSQNVEAVVGQWRKRFCACVKEKGHHVEHLLNWNQLFSEPTHYTTGSFQSHQQSTEENTLFLSRHFRRSYLQVNKVSKSEGTRKVEYAYHFWKCDDVVYQKLSKLVLSLSKLQLAKFVAFLRHSV